MSKLAVVYWSSTGNTEAMAEAILEGIKNAGAEAELFTPDNFDASMMDDFDAVAFGCPASGSESLEEAEFEPMFSACEEKLSGKKIALFGAYGWGGGPWMRDWEELCRSKDAVLVSEGLICHETPDDDVLEQCRNLGAELVKAI